MDFSVRSYQKELLDQGGLPFKDIQQNMRELHVINSLLGGHQISLSGFKKLVAGKNKITVCEIGCGDGNNLITLKKWCDKKKVGSFFTGIDINEHCIEYAKSKTAAENFQFIISDFRHYQFGEKPDIIFSSLFCHHFDDAALTAMLKWMQSNSKIGFFINDLHRNPFAYYSIKILTRIFSKSYLVKNDAPLSVLKGFKRSEWEKLLQKSRISNYELQWKWAFRWLIVSKNNNAIE